MKTPTEKFQEKHGDRYDYSKSVYVTAKTKLIVICKVHGEFLITPNNHLSGSGCPKCSGSGFSKEEKVKIFTEKSNSIHNGVYDYSLINVSNIHEKKLPIICKEHGTFHQSIVGHITNKSGCPSCGYNKNGIKNRQSMSTFLEKSKITHGELYDYSRVNLQGGHKKVEIICKDHGSFFVTPVNHWSNKIGCTVCSAKNMSKGEQKIKNFLDHHSIKHECQKTFTDLPSLKKNGRLRYDFFLPDHNLLIEYDGEHHHMPITFNKKISAEDAFDIIQARDKMKTDYAKMNGISLCRIRYDQDILAEMAKIIPAFQDDDTLPHKS